MSEQDPDGALPAWAALIRDRREAAMPAMSKRRAARLAGMSDSTWLAMENGDPQRSTRASIAKAALLLDITPRELEETGRPDAARALRTLLKQKVDQAPGVPGALREAAEADAREGRDGVLVEMAQGLADIDANPYLTGRQKAAVREEFLAGIARDIGRRRADLRTVLRVAHGGDVG